MHIQRHTHTHKHTLTHTQSHACTHTHAGWAKYKLTHKTCLINTYTKRHTHTHTHTHKGPEPCWTGFVLLERPPCVNKHTDETSPEGLILTWKFPLNQLRVFACLWVCGQGCWLVVCVRECVCMCVCATKSKQNEREIEWWREKRETERKETVCGSSDWSSAPAVYLFLHPSFNNQHLYVFSHKAFLLTLLKISCFLSLFLREKNQSLHPLLALLPHLSTSHLSLSYSVLQPNAPFYW